MGGSGFGPDGGTAHFYREQGLRTIPGEGPLSVAVPGAVAALSTLAELATRPLSELWEPAARAGEVGIPCSAKTRSDIIENRTAIARDPETAAVFLPGGDLPGVGDRLYYGDLTATIRLLARDPLTFYTGTLAEPAIELLRGAGAPFSGDEWSLGRVAPLQRSITGRYAGQVVHQTPLRTPGWMILQQAAVCDGTVGAYPLLSADAVNLLAEAARAAFDDRWERCASDNDAWRGLLSESHIAEQRRGVTAGRSSAMTGAVGDGDTAWTVAVDANELAVSFIHSLTFTFGARSPCQERASCSTTGSAGARTSSLATRTKSGRGETRCIPSTRGLLPEPTAARPMWATRRAATGTSSGTCNCCHICWTTVSTLQKRSLPPASPRFLAATPTSSSRRRSCIASLDWVLRHSRRCAAAGTTSSLRARGPAAEAHS